MVFGLFMYGFDGDDIPVFDTKYDVPDTAPMPPILPVKREWRAAGLEAADGPGPHIS